MRDWLKTPTGRIALSFVKAFVAGVATAVVAGQVADVSTAKQVVIAAFIAAVDATLKGVQIATEKA